MASLESPDVIIHFSYFWASYSVIIKSTRNSKALSLLLVNFSFTTNAGVSISFYILAMIFFILSSLWSCSGGKPIFFSSILLDLEAELCELD